MKIRLKFTKEGPVKYVGHLDTMRLFQRAIKVARIPVAYSQGFSPHSLVYFALPLAVGVSSAGEYMDIITQEDVEAKEVMNHLNKVLVDGITICDAFRVDEKMDSLMSLVAAADYEVKLILPEGIILSGNELEDKLNHAAELIVMKKGKKGIKPVDIKPLVLEGHVTQEEGNLFIKAKVLAGSSQNLNPELLVKALMENVTEEYEIQVSRKELYTEGEAGYQPLYTFGRL